MRKRQLQQIKIFKVEHFKTTEDLEESVNKYVIEMYNKEGNYPTIKTNSKFVSVISHCLLETNYKSE